MEDPLASAYREDGGLYSLGWYLAWSPGEAYATLDGQFKADDLLAIAQHMRGRPSLVPKPDRRMGDVEVRSPDGSRVAWSDGIGVKNHSGEPHS